ncbi:MAG: hypothetical protein ACYC27_12115 [Armatimonadota bacterium]
MNKQIFTSPREFPMYDLEWAKNLTLDKMSFTEINRTVIDGIECVEVAFSAFDQPFATLDGGVIVLPWRQRGQLYLPSEPRAGLHQGVLFNVHDILGYEGWSGTQVDWGVGIARAFGIPVLIHGWAADVVFQIANMGYHSTQLPVLNHFWDLKIEKYDDLPIDGRYMVINGNPLVKGDMVAITMFQRLVSNEIGMTIDEVGSLGISKEGSAHWILGAVDDRIAVLALGGAAHHLPGDMMERYMADWKGICPPVAAAMEGFGDWVRLMMQFGNYSLSTEAGRVMDKVNSPKHWPEQIYARHVMMCGDIGQHDGAWPITCENSFYKSFTHPSYRYVRAYDGTGVMFDEGIGEVGRGVFPHVADLLVYGSETPDTPQVTAEEQGRQATIHMRCTVDDCLESEAILVYVIAPDRALTMYSPDISWQIVPMQPLPSKPGELEAEYTLDVPESHQMTYIVIIREQVERSPITYWRTASSMPKECFPLPEHQGEVPFNIDW